MNNIYSAGRRRRGVVTAAALLAAICCPDVHAKPATDRAGQPDLSVGAAEYPDADAIIVRWDQEWTIRDDGAVTRRDHKWVKLLNSRPIRRFGDPRVDFQTGYDEVVIRTARAHLPGGEILPVPDYGFNLGAARDVDGWPEYAGWQQHIVSFSGIEPGVTLELDYEVTTKAGVLPWVSEDIRLDDQYPVIEHRIAVRAPAGREILVRTANLADRKNISANAKNTFDWTFGPYAGSPDEPHSLPWYDRRPRLYFSTVTPSEWIAAQLRAVDGSAQPDSRIEAFVVDAGDGAADAEDRLRGIASRIKNRFNIITSLKTRRDSKCRPAGEILRTNYGSPLEAGALLLAACRAAGLNAEAFVAVEADRWDGEVALDSAFAGIVVAVHTDNQTIYAQPAKGVLVDPERWSDHILLSLGADGSVETMPILRRGEQSGSELLMVGKLIVDEDGSVAGEFRVRMTGAFYDPQSLESSTDQKKMLGRLIGHVSQSLSIDDHSIQELSPDVLAAVARVSTDDALAKIGEAHTFEMSQTPAFLDSFPMPLERSSRRTAVRLPSSFRAHLDLTIEYPEGWSARIVPEAVEQVDAPWGSLSQSVEHNKNENKNENENSVRLIRRVSVNSDTLSPDAFLSVRAAVNRIRAAGSRVFCFGQ